MKSPIRLGLYLMSSKGLAVLKATLERFGSGIIGYVVVARDEAVAEDYYDEIVGIAHAARLQIYSRNDTNAVADDVTYLFAVSWRWMLTTNPRQQLIVFHDSILPRYRGFAPVVSALVNGDTSLGVTALLAASDYDRGPIIAQKTIQVTYPIKVAVAIDALIDCYTNLAIEITDTIINRELTFTEQDESLATYSLWRNDYDYFIDWTWDSERICRFVNAVGFPYKGAATVADGETYRVLECTGMNDVVVENRVPGKVIFVIDHEPVVVCGSGLLRIHRMIEAQLGKNALPLKQFRTCFHTPARSQLSSSRNYRDADH